MKDKEFRKEMEMKMKWLYRRIEKLECFEKNGHQLRFDHAYKCDNRDAFNDWYFLFICLDCKETKTYYGLRNVPAKLKAQIKAVSPDLIPKKKK
jgi:hypothetical protein